MRLDNEHGHALIDVIAGLVLMALMIFTLHQIFIPTFALSRNSSERLERQQDVRLAIDRIARDLHETAAHRIIIYEKADGCRDTYQACIGFVTPRADCSGYFQLAGGFPRWQATIYIWREVSSNELRRLCDASTTFPTSRWPPKLTVHTVIGTNITEAAFAFLPAGSANPTSISISLREQADGATRPSHRYQTEFVSQTVLLPQNR